MLDSRLKAYGLSAMVFAIDRLSKSIVEAHVSPFDVHPVIPGFFDIVHSQNRGVAFGLMNESNSAWRTVVLIAFSAAALLLVADRGRDQASVELRPSQLRRHRVHAEDREAQRQRPVLQHALQLHRRGLSEV